MEALSTSDLFILIAAGASVAIAAVAVGLSVVYYHLAGRLFRKTEEAVDEIENSVNQMYGALTKLSKRSESCAAEIEERVLQLQEVAEQICQDAKLFNKAAAPAIEQPQPPYNSFFDPQPRVEKAPLIEALNREPGQTNGNGLQQGVLRSLRRSTG